ncbi:MAG: hypothetical protein WC460_00160 [Patescibacteria group bacterium]
MFNIFSKFKAPLYREAAEAYWNKLPQEIEVSWFRDGKYIIGQINAEGNKFMTQGRNADEFIDMVNDAVFSVYEIPPEYFEILSPKKFTPKSNEYERLRNNGIIAGEISLERQLVNV